MYELDTKRIVIKIGSNVLTRDDGTMDITRMSSIVDQVAWLWKKGVEVIMVTSGAVASGKSILKHEDRLDKVEQRQLFSAIGQVMLMSHYTYFFWDYSIYVGQVLTMKENFTREEEYDNLQRCMNAMLENGVIPIMNENDTVCITELMFTDNDELSGLTAKMMKADTLLILSDIDGLYDGNPEESGATLIRHIDPDEDLSRYISSKKSSAGRGGMESKCKTAEDVARSGIRVIVANGKRENVITNLFSNPEDVPHTEFSKL